MITSAQIIAQLLNADLRETAWFDKNFRFMISVGFIVVLWNSCLRAQWLGVGLRLLGFWFVPFAVANFASACMHARARNFTSARKPYLC